MKPANPGRKPLYRILYAQVLFGVALGIAVGLVAPGFAKKCLPLGDGFVKLIKMLIAPVIFCTVVHGIASLTDLKKLGRTGLKTILYFEAVSTLALVIGLVVVNVMQPGAGFNVDAQKLDPKIADTYAQKAHDLTATGFILNLIPSTFFGAFVNGDLLQVLCVAGLCGVALAGMGAKGQPMLRGIEQASQLFFGVMAIVVRLAPIGAFGAMAFTVGSYGIGALNKLLALMAGFYITAAFFVFAVLGAICRANGFSIVKFLGYIKHELLLVLGTSSSETALPGMIQKLRRLGCSPSTVGLVIPTGYSFNLDGTNIYMSMAAIFLAQATNTPLDLKHQILLLLVAMATSKGASGVTGAGFIALAATLAAMPGIPLASLALLVGIDRFMSECRAITNLIGNGVATLVISRWENEVTAETINANLKLG